MRLAWCALMACVAIAIGCGETPPPAVDASVPVDPARCAIPCPRFRIGEPTWEPADALLVSADFGGTLDSYLDVLSLAFAPNHPVTGDALFAPSPFAHPGPYRGELEGILLAAGLTPRDRFTVDDASGTRLIALFVMLVPTDDAPRGSSPDFAEGAIISNTLFPLFEDTDLLREGQPFDPYNDTRLFATDAFTPPALVDGWSHLVYVHASGAAFAPPGVETRGNFVYRTTIVDSRNNGWRLEVPFRIE